ncbi:MAG: ABC transporter permease [Chloroflexota bacterium]
MGASFTANYMFDSISSEANDRTIEIVITSISPMQFLVGKVVGLLLVGLTQLTVWGSLALILAVWASRFAEIDLFGLILGWEHLGVTISLLLGAYVLMQLFAAMVGMLQINSGSGPLLFNTLNWAVGFSWIYAIAIVPRTPHTLLAVGASLFPLSAPIVLLVRIIVSEVPLWQVIVSQCLLWGTAVASLFWLRRLLQTNLVSYAPNFRLWPWLRGKVLSKNKQGV